MRNFSKLMAFFAIGMITFSCVEDDDFAVPDTAPVAFVLPDNADFIDLEAIVDQIEQSRDGIVTVEDTPDRDLYTSGFVISSDQAGNFFEEIVIQDAPENPTTGLLVLIDDSPLSGSYQVGQRIYIKLDGLSLGTSNGVPVLGLLGAGNDIEKIPAALRNQTVLRDSEVATLVPTEINSASEFNDDLLLTYIQFPAVQFASADVGRTFASEPTDQFDGLRFLQTCADFFASPIRLETSTFADFRGNRLFDGSGTVNAILTRDFEDDNFVVVVNSLADFNFDPSVRCNFDVVSCGTASGPGATSILNEDFETVFTNPAEPAGWTNFIENGSEAWEVYTDTGANASLGRSVRAGSFRSGDAQSTAWLITPQIDFDAQTGEVFSFDNSNSFSDGSELQVLFSSDWDGTEANIATATWEALADAAIVDDSENFRNWVSSGQVSLDCLTGTGYIAFKYEGSGDSGSDGTYEVDNIVLTSN